MKRLLCIVSSLDAGGAETFMMKIFRSFPDKYKLDFVVSTEKGFYEKEVVELGGKIHRVPLRTQHPFKTFQKIMDIVKKEGYESVLKLCDTPIGFFDLLACKMGGAKTICVRSCNASSDESIPKHILNSLLRPLFNQIANVKIAPSKMAAEYTFGKKQVEKNNVHFLHNAVDLNVYQYSEEGRKRIRQEFKIGQEELLIGHVGRFNKQKNHMFLLDVFVSVKKIRSDAKLLLVGDGENKSDVIDRAEQLGIQNSIIFTGIRADIPDLLSAMDVFAFPSLYEGMPNTIIEAQAVGLPCVLSDSITREAEITNLLRYISLNEKSVVWAKNIIESVQQKRIDTKKELINEGYEIHQTVCEFINMVFDKGVNRNEQKN